MLGAEARHCAYGPKSIVSCLLYWAGRWFLGVSELLLCPKADMPQRLSHRHICRKASTSFHGSYCLAQSHGKSNRFWRNLETEIVASLTPTPAEKPQKLPGSPGVSFQALLP